MILIWRSVNVSYLRLGNKVKLSWNLSSITKSDNGLYTLLYETPDGMVSLESKSVVMTVPSYVASSILHPVSVSETGLIFVVVAKWDC